MRRPLLFVFFISLFACSKNEAQVINDSTQLHPLKLRYLALGDSYTIGTAIGPEKAYPQIFADSVRQEASLDSFFVQVIAQNGWTTADLKNGITTTQPDSSFNLVTILIGVNNQYQRRSITEYENEFSQLLQDAIAFADGDSSRVLVLSIPDWGVSPAGAGNRALIAEEIDNFNAAQKQIALTEGVRFVDITTLSRSALSDPSLIASDGLHFSAKMQQQWLDLLYPHLVESLKF